MLFKPKFNLRPYKVKNILMKNKENVPKMTLKICLYDIKSMCISLKLISKIWNVNNGCRIIKKENKTDKTQKQKPICNYVVS